MKLINNYVYTNRRSIKRARRMTRREREMNKKTIFPFYQSDTRTPLLVFRFPCVRLLFDIHFLCNSILWCTITALFTGKQCYLSGCKAVYQNVTTDCVRSGNILRRYGVCSVQYLLQNKLRFNPNTTGTYNHTSIKYALFLYDTLLSVSCL